MDVFFDTEATLADPKLASFLCGVVWWRGDLVCFNERQIDELGRVLDFASGVFVFNADYDYTLMECHGIESRRVESWRHKTIDFFEQTRKSVGVWPSLDSVALANGIVGKSSSGSEIGGMSFEEMVSYCGRDVEILYELSQLERLVIPILCGKKDERKEVGRCVLDWRTGAVSGLEYY